MITITCQWCGKPFQVKPCRATVAKFCSISCNARHKVGDLHPRKRETELRKCLNCGKEYAISKNFDRKIKFCSKACSSKYNFSGERQRKWSGGPHVFKCKACGKESTKRRGCSGGNTPEYCSRDCSKIGRNTQIMVSCPGCAKEFLAHPSWLKKGHQYCSISCYRHNRIKPNTIEAAIQKGLEDRGVIFVTEYPIFRYHIDIFIPSANLAVECDGDYWHRGRQNYDAYKTSRLLENGISVIRLKESEIRQSPADCIDRIMSKIASAH